MTRLAGVFEASVAIISAEPSDDDHTFAIMTPRQIALVQSSWEKVVPISAEAAALFYRRLFELDPSLRALFTTDITEQGKKLMAMLSVVVRGLTRLEEIVPAVKAMGRRHLSYGVKDEDYETVGSALLWTLGQGLGAAFDQETREAWATAYGLLSVTMQEAARQPA